MAYFGGLWAPQRCLKAPFAAKFGMHLGLLTVFSGPVHDHVRGTEFARVPLDSVREGRKCANAIGQNESKWAQTGSKGVKKTQKGSK